MKIKIKQSTLEANHKALSELQIADTKEIRGGWHSNVCNGTGMLGNNVDYDDLIECPGCEACLNPDWVQMDEDGEET